MAETDFWKNIIHFDKEEFNCKCGCGLNNINKELVEKLDLARSYSIGSVFTLNSACRCTKHNKKVNGSDSSSHLLGLAVDIKVRSSHTRHKILVALLGAGFTRIGIYKKFIHVDIDYDKPKNLIWYV